MLRGHLTTLLPTARVVPLREDALDWDENQRRPCLDILFTDLRLVLVYALGSAATMLGLSVWL
jgi:hypothetical protein